jgi:hypothetical protein
MPKELADFGPGWCELYHTEKVDFYRECTSFSINNRYNQRWINNEYVDNIITIEIGNSMRPSNLLPIEDFRKMGSEEFFSLFFTGLSLVEKEIEKFDYYEIYQYEKVDEIYSFTEVSIHLPKVINGRVKIAGQTARKILSVKNLARKPFELQKIMSKLKDYYKLDYYSLAIGKM